MPIENKKAKVVKNIRVNDRDNLLVLQATGPQQFSFVPGQFVSLRVDEFQYRAYSICSDPRDGDQGLFKLIISSSHEGVGANFVRSLNADDEVEFLGPRGTFKLHSANAPNILLVATGTGIAPFISMLYQLKHEKSQTKIRLLHGIRFDGHSLFKPELKSFKKDLHDFDYTICHSQSKYSPLPETCLFGRVTDHIQVEEPQNTHIYLCGNPDMISDAVQLLQKLEVPDNAVFYEKFTVKQ